MNAYAIKLPKKLSPLLDKDIEKISNSVSTSSDSSKKTSENKPNQMNISTSKTDFKLKIEPCNQTASLNLNNNVPNLRKNSNRFIKKKLTTIEEIPNSPYADLTPKASIKCFEINFKESISSLSPKNKVFGTDQNIDLQKI